MVSELASPGRCSVIVALLSRVPWWLRSGRRPERGKCSGITLHWLTYFGTAG